MNTNQIVGVVGLVLGAMLLGSAYQADQAPLQLMSDGFNGRHAVQAMWYLLGGIGVALGGGLLAAFGRRLQARIPAGRRAFERPNDIMSVTPTNSPFECPCTIDRRHQPATGIGD